MIYTIIRIMFTTIIQWITVLVTLRFSTITNIKYCILKDISFIFDNRKSTKTE